MRPLRLALSLGLLVATALEHDARACSACGCGDQTLTAFGLEKPYLNRVRLSVDERYTELRFGDVFDGATNRTLRSSIAIGWIPHRRVAVAALLPLVTSWVTPLSGRRTQQIVGLGDLELSTRVMLYGDRTFMANHILWGVAGLKTPTGPLVRDSAGFPVDVYLQPGSGSWDPFAGATYAYFGGLVSFF